MIQNWFAMRNSLAAASRIISRERFRERITAAEIALLLLCGAAAALASGFLRLGLHIPGNAIIRVVVPMALGLSLAPRRFAGCIMSSGALGTAAVVTAAGLGPYDPGAFASLCLTGPIMDFALARAQSGWLLYLRLAFAGIIINLLALAMRAGTKLMGFDVADARPFVIWWPQALFTYILCGAVAGLIGAVCCFRLRTANHPR